MKQAIIRFLFNGLDDWQKWEVYKSLTCPSLDKVLAQQEKDAERIFGKKV